MVLIQVGTIAAKGFNQDDPLLTCAITVTRLCNSGAKLLVISLTRSFIEVFY